MKKILITGANSYIGTSVEKYILENYPTECSFETLSLRSDDWKEKSFADYDVVFHVAGIAHQKETKENVESYYKINCDLAIEVAQKSKADGVKQFIFLSSMSVYGLITGHITSDTQLKPNTNYGKSKLQAEERIQTLADDNFKICVLRPPMIYGAGCKGNYQTLRKFALKFKLLPYVKNERSMLYIENLCVFIRLMILNEESGIYYPQNKEFTNTSEMIRTIAMTNGIKTKFVKGMGWAVKLLGLLSGSAKKAFGSLTYDRDMSKYKNEYSLVDLYDSIAVCERNEHD